MPMSEKKTNQVDKSLEALAQLFPSRVERRTGAGLLGRYGQAEDSTAENREVEELINTWGREAVIRCAKKAVHGGLWSAKTLRNLLVTSEERDIKATPTDVVRDALAIVERYGHELVGAGIEVEFADGDDAKAQVLANEPLAIDIVEWESQRIRKSGDKDSQVIRTPDSATEATGTEANDDDDGNDAQVVVMPQDAQGLFGRSGWAKEGREALLAQVQAIPYDPSWELTKTQIETYDRAASTVRFLSRLTVHMACLIGQALHEARAAMPHGRFRWFIEHKMQLTKSTAANYMRMASTFPDSTTVGHLSLGVAYKLAARRVSDDVRQQAVQKRNDAEALEVLKAQRSRGTVSTPEGADSFSHTVEGVSTSGKSTVPFIVEPVALAACQEALVVLQKRIAALPQDQRRTQAEEALELVREALAGES